MRMDSPCCVCLPAKLTFAVSVLRARTDVRPYAAHYSHARSPPLFFAPRSFAPPRAPFRPPAAPGFSLYLLCQSMQTSLQIRMPRCRIDGFVHFPIPSTHIECQIRVGRRALTKVKVPVQWPVVLNAWTLSSCRISKHEERREDGGSTKIEYKVNNGLSATCLCVMRRKRVDTCSSEVILSMGRARVDSDSAGTQFIEDANRR